MRRVKIAFAGKRIREEETKSATCFTSGIVVRLLWGTEWHADSVQQEPRHGGADELRNSGKRLLATKRKPLSESLYSEAGVRPPRNLTRGLWPAVSASEGGHNLCESRK